MRFSNKILQKSYFVFALMGAFLLSACGSADSGADGIYAKNERQNRNTTQTTSNTNKYKGYFANQNEQLAQMSEYMNQEEEEVFVDADGYSSENGQAYQDEYVYEDEYAPANTAWGTNPTTVNINYYGSSYYNPYM